MLQRRLKFIRRHIVLVFCLVCIVYICGKVILINRNGDALYDSIGIYSQSEINNKMWMKSFNATTGNWSPVRPMRTVLSVDCAAIIAGNKTAIEKAKAYMSLKTYSRRGISDNEYIQLTKDCHTFKRTRAYMNYKMSLEEKQFPIAYSILLYKDVEQAERLLRAIYRPNNLYCLHVDADSKPDVHHAIQGIADCFDNVFVVSRKEYVVYSGYTRLQADLNCMENLLERGNSWKYFINLPSQQFPLKTNSELVKILKIYNGANDVEGIIGGKMLPSRFKFRYVYKHVPSKIKPKIFKTAHKKDNPPYNVSVVKGSAYGVFSRQFVEFVSRDRIARELLEWFRDVLSPDEYYWSTLHHNPHIGTPGAYKGKPDGKPWLAVFAAWGGVTPCAGKFVRGVCVFGVGDLKSIVTRKEMFANKFYLEYQPLGLSCMEEWLHNRTVERTSKYFNETYYRSLPFIHEDGS